MNILTQLAMAHPGRNGILLSWSWSVLVELPFLPDTINWLILRARGDYLRWFRCAEMCSINFLACAWQFKNQALESVCFEMSLKVYSNTWIVSKNKNCYFIFTLNIFQSRQTIFWISYNEEWGQVVGRLRTWCDSDIFLPCHASYDIRYIVSKNTDDWCRH